MRRFLFCLALIFLVLLPVLPLYGLEPFATFTGIAVGLLVLMATAEYLGLALGFGADGVWRRMRQRFPQRSVVAGSDWRGTVHLLRRSGRRCISAYQDLLFFEYLPVVLVMGADGFSARVGRPFNLLLAPVFIEWAQVENINVFSASPGQRALYFNIRGESGLDFLLELAPGAVLPKDVADLLDLAEATSPASAWETPAAASAALASATPAVWWVVRGKERPRSYSRDELKALAERGELLASDSIWWTGLKAPVPPGTLHWLGLAPAPEPLTPLSAAEREHQAAALRALTGAGKPVGAGLSMVGVFVCWVVFEVAIHFKFLHRISLWGLTPDGQSYSVYLLAEIGVLGVVVYLLAKAWR